MRSLTARLSGATLLSATLGLCALAGFGFGVLAVPLYHNRNFPWIVARASGVGAFIALGGLCVVGLLFRRPRRRRGTVHPETLLRLHGALGAAVCALLATHVISLLADRYSGVRWPALMVPNAATYRPGAVTYGMLAMALLVLIVVTAGLAGRRPVGARWAVVHRLAYPCFGLVWVHGVLAGSDTRPLETLYIAVGAAVVASALPRLWREPTVARSGTAA